MLATALLSALLVTRTVQQSGKNPTQDVCRRHKHQTCVIDSKLYIYGGLAYYGGGMNESTLETNNFLLWEDLSKAEGTKYSFPEQYSNGTINPSVPLVSGGALWPDTVNKIFYLFGGEYSNTAELNKKTGQGGFTLWYYDTIYDKWESPSSDGSKAKIRWPALGASTVSDGGIAYYYGGYLTNTSDSDTLGLPVMQNALISYNMDSRVWGLDTGNPTPRAEGSMHYLPVSDRGMLVYFGGVEANLSGGETLYANMTDIHLFDIASATWYTQTASGDVPEPRRGYCAGVVWAQDQSSYNIYLFGGFRANGTGLGDLYVLSIPSFQWIAIYPIPKQDVFPGGKGYTSCNIFRESQMMIIGGLQPNVSKIDCDVPVIGGQHNMWLGQENVEYLDEGGKSNWWHAPMDNVTGYRVPDQITRVIGGDTNGHAATTAPEGPWATDDLPRLFGRRFTAQSRSLMSGRTIPTTSATSPPTVSPSSPAKKTEVGAIAGGAVAGAVVLIGVIAGVLLCLRRKRRKQQSQGSGQPSEVTEVGHTRSPDIANKSTTSASVMQGSTLASPMPQSPAYSHQGSPPPTSSPWRQEMHMPASYYQGSPSPQQQSSPPLHHQSGDWGQQAGFVQLGNYPQGSHTYQQTYYPPPPDPSVSSASPNKENLTHMSDIQEMPNVRSPAITAAEMSDVRSPAPQHGQR